MNLGKVLLCYQYKLSFHINSGSTLRMLHLATSARWQMDGETDDNTPSTGDNTPLPRRPRGKKPKERF